MSKAGQPLVDSAKVKAAERLDGKFVACSNDDPLSAEDMALDYKQLQRVEGPGGNSKAACARSTTGQCIASTPQWH